MAQVFNGRIAILQQFGDKKDGLPPNIGATISLTALTRQA
jgi:hypothetical protein